MNKQGNRQQKNSNKKVSENENPNAKNQEEEKYNLPEEDMGQEDWSIEEALIEKQDVANGVAERYDKDPIKNSHDPEHEQLDEDGWTERRIPPPI